MGETLAKYCQLLVKGQGVGREETKVSKEPAKKLRVRELEAFPFGVPGKQWQGTGKEVFESLRNSLEPLQI